MEERNVTAFVNGESEAEHPSHRFFNRELSWLQFNRRVLHEALDDRTPLLERVVFLSIFTSNLDENYQKRVGGLKRQIAAGVLARSIDGMTPQQQLLAIRHDVLDMLAVQAKAFTQEIRPALARQGIALLDWQELTDAERQFADRYFQRNLFPVLTPLAVDPGHPFPFISNLSMSLGVTLRHPPDHPDAGVKQFARVKVPKVLPRWVRLLPRVEGADDKSRDDGPFRFVHVMEIIRNNLEDLFAGMIIDEAEPFRITRNADVEREEEEAEDLLDLIEQELRDRRFADVIRLEIKDRHTLEMLPFLTEELHLEETDIYRLPAELDYTDLLCIYSLNMPQLKFEH